MRKLKKETSGITLIALVITIIVLLILAGVSLSFVVGNNGVLTQASVAVVKNREAAAKEEIAMAWSSLETEYWTKWAQNSATTRASVFNEDNMRKYLAGKGIVNSLEYNEGGMSTVSYTSNTDPNLPYLLEIDANGAVTIEGTSAEGGNVAATDVEYIASDNSWNPGNVQNAITLLYSKLN